MKLADMPWPLFNALLLLLLPSSLFTPSFLVSAYEYDPSQPHVAGQLCGEHNSDTTPTRYLVDLNFDASFYSKTFANRLNNDQVALQLRPDGTFWTIKVSPASKGGSNTDKKRYQYVIDLYYKDPAPGGTSGVKSVYVVTDEFCDIGGKVPYSWFQDATVSERRVGDLQHCSAFTSNRQKLRSLPDLPKASDLSYLNTYGHDTLGVHHMDYGWIIVNSAPVPEFLRQYVVDIHIDIGNKQEIIKSYWIRAKDDCQIVGENIDEAKINKIAVNYVAA